MAAAYHVGLGRSHHLDRHSAELHWLVHRSHLCELAAAVPVSDMHGRSDHQLGITEAGLFPGVSFYLTMWYRRHEVNFRIALFFSAATIAGAFGGLLARLINLMNDVAGLEGYVKTSITTLFAGRHRLFLGVPSACDAYSRPDGAGSSSWREFSPLS